MEYHIPILTNITYISFFFLIIIITTTFFPHQSHAQPLPPHQQPQPVYNYQICREINSYNCGSISNISYPFWGQNLPFYCGAGELNHLCLENITTIQLSSQIFTVLEINTTTHTIKLRRTDLDHNLCSPKFVDTYLSPPLFQYHSNVKNITIYYNCTSTYSQNLAEHSLCGSHYPSFGHVGDEDNLFREYPSLKCQKRIKVPVGADFHGEIDYFKRGELERVLNEGFEVKYNVNENCSKCLGSEGGDCWSEYFHKYVDLCYYDNCSDGSTHCPKHPVNWKRKLVIGNKSNFP